MKRTARLALLVAAMAGVPALVGAAAGAAGTATIAPPEIRLATTVLTPGASVAIHGTHWPEGTTLQAVLCGAKAIDGTVDCVERAAVTMSPGPSGVVDGVLNVFMPPRPCPCVVLVSGLTSSYTERIPVEVVGASTAPVESRSPVAAPPALRATAEITGGTTLASVFGGPASRTVVLKIVNTGPVAVPHPVVVLAWGRSGSADHVIPTPRLDLIGPGATRTLKIPFDLDAFSMGNYEVSGRVNGASKTVQLSASTSTWPWGLLILVLIMVQFVLLGVRNRARRGLARKQAAARLDALGGQVLAYDAAIDATSIAATRGDEPIDEDVEPVSNGTVTAHVPTAAVVSGETGAPRIRWSMLQPISWRPCDDARDQVADRIEWSDSAMP